MAPSGYADYSDKALSGLPVFVVKELHDPSEEELAPYGHYVDVPGGFEDWASTVKISTEGGVAHGPFSVWSSPKTIHARNDGIKMPEYTIASRLDDRSVTPHALVREVNNHPTSEQLFHPLSGQRFALLLAPAAVGCAHLQPGDLRLVHFSGKRSVVISMGTWHQPPYGDGVYYTAQAASHECEDVDFVTRDSLVLALPTTDFGVQP